MAEPADSYPDSATLGADERTDGQTPEALREALADHDEALAAAIERTDELEDVLATAVVVAASADEGDLDYLTDSTSNLVAAVDGLSTEGTAELAEDLGEQADDLADVLTVAAALGESLSPSEVEELAAVIDENGSDLVDALDVVLELHREDRLADLVDLAGTLSTLEIDDDTAAGLNTLLGAVGEAQRESEPRSLLGLLRDLRGADVRAGLGFLLSLVSALGRRVRGR